MLTATLVGAALTLAAGTHTPATADETTGLTIERVGVSAENGGYPTIHYGFYGLAVTFTDTTPDGTHRYVATATEVEGDGTVVEEEVSVWEKWDGTYAVRAHLPNDKNMALGDAFEVVVSEFDGDTLVDQSAPVAYTVTAISHPSNLEVKSKRDGFLKAGEVVKLRWTGTYGDDAGHVTQVIAARPKGAPFSTKRKDFLVCKNSYCPTKAGTKWVETDSKELTTRFRVPKRFRGMTLVISIYGQPRHEDGVAPATPWGWFYEVKVRR